MSNSNIVVFTPKSELDHEKNLQDFIEFSGKLPLLNDKYVPDSNYWAGLGNFTVFGISSKDRKPENVLDTSLLPFAKAYITYENGSVAGRNTKFQALRAVNASCVETHGFVDVTKLTQGDLDKAADSARKSLSEGAAYQAGRGIANLLKFLIKKKMHSPMIWKSPIRKPADDPVGDEADVIRQARMPDEDALMALASIASKDSAQLSQRDIAVTSTMTFLFSAPSRGSEPFYLRSDCLHSEKLSANKALDMGLPREDIELLLSAKKAKEVDTLIDANGAIVESDKKSERFDWDEKITLVGVKWYSGKGYGHECKWLPTVMIPSVKISVERLNNLSADARDFAKKLEESPDFPRHKLCPDVPEDQLLTVDEVSLAFGMDYRNAKKKSNRNAFLKARGVTNLEDFSLSLKDINVLVRDRLPKGFPFIPFTKGSGVEVKWSNSLYAGFKHALSTERAPILTELEIITINTLNEDLAPTKKINKRTGEPVDVLSLFQRHGFGNLSLTSHQLRHLLDTMAAINGMDGDMRAKWAMRSDPAHNRYYDHTTPEEYCADFHEEQERQVALQEQNSFESSPIKVFVATPRTLQELNTKAGLTAHATDFGICFSSYISEPCGRYRDCINCNEHGCMKGDDAKCERLRKRAQVESKLLKMDEKAVNNGVPGAAQWFERRKLTTERYGELIAMMDDPSIPDGSLIKLASVEPVSLLDRAMDANGKKRLPKIENFQRIKAKAEVEVISVDELIGITSQPSVTDDPELDNFDHLDGFDDDLLDFLSGEDNG